MLNEKQRLEAFILSKVREQDSSIGYVQEEMGELLQALGKLRRGAPGAMEKVKEELSHAIFTLSILAYHVGKQDVSDNIDEVIERLDGKSIGEKIRSYKKKLKMET